MTIQASVTRRGLMASAAAAGSAVALPALSAELPVDADPLIALGEQWHAALADLKRIGDAGKAAAAALPAWAAPGPAHRSVNGRLGPIVGHPEWDLSDPDIAGLWRSFIIRPSRLDVQRENWQETWHQPAGSPERARREAVGRRRLAYYEKRRRQQQAAREAVGLPALDAAEEVAVDRCGAVEDAIMEATATTPAGVLVKLRVALSAAGYYPDGASLDDADFDVKLLAGALRDLERLTAA